MPRDSRARRPARAATGGGDHATAAGELFEPLVSLLARTPRAVDLLAQLHRRAVEACGGTCSLLFEHNPRNGVLQATSGSGLDELRMDPWTPEGGEAQLVAAAFARGVPTLVASTDAQMPDLAERLGVSTALLLPLVQGDRRAGILAVGYATAPRASEAPGPEAIEVADAFVTALELFRLRRKQELEGDVRELITEFTASLAATLNLTAGLDLFCHGANRLFGADRTSVWLYERRARALALTASSDSGHVSRKVRVSAEDPLAPAAAAMRSSRAEILPAVAGAATRIVTVPLRGTRRALGTTVFEGVRVEPGGELDLLDRADEIGRQLASAIENMQLLDDVMRSRRELENTFDSIAHLVVVADRRGRIVHANEAFAGRLKRRREELIDRPLAEFVGADLIAWLEAHAQSGPAADGAPAATVEITDPVLDGPFMVTVTDLLNQERESVGSVVVARDLTPQSRLEAEREQLRRQLTQSEKLAALGQFVAGIAHELNNPLQGVLGHLELLKVTGAFPKQLRREVQTIYREADRAAKIVKNLLVFAGSRRLARRSVSLTGVLQKVVALRQPACRALDVEVVRHYEEKLPRVQSDPLLLHQVFLNMVLNAEHAIAETQRPGRIELRASASPSRDRVVATVRDTGPGIPEDALSRIFEPFFTTREVGQGTGLGLAIAYGIVQEHGGSITAANHPDGGAIFTVELPVAPAASRNHD
jgi:C4-dicarboxylate-specific signal transduction histidine kinase